MDHDYKDSPYTLALLRLAAARIPIRLQEPNGHCLAALLLGRYIDIKAESLTHIWPKLTATGERTLLMLEQTTTKH
jgi:hypothetical protein